MSRSFKRTPVVAIRQIRMIAEVEVEVEVEEKENG